VSARSGEDRSADVTIPPIIPVRGMKTGIVTEQIRQSDGTSAVRRQGRGWGAL